MRVTQRARRWLNRVRRFFIGRTDNEPIVEIDGQASPRQNGVAARARREAGRWARMAAGFVGTLAVLGLVYGASVAWRERVSLPLDPAEAAAPATGSRAIAAAAALLSLTNLDSERDAWFAPSARKARLAAFQDGAADAVAAFIEVVERRRAGRDKDLAVAAAALAGESSDPPAVRYAAARDALRRFNTRAGRKGPPVDRGQRALAALARAASASVQSHDHALRVAAAGLHPGAIVGQARAEFYRARGQAYAWRLLLRAYAEDAPQSAQAALAKPLSDAREALAAAASFEPLLLVSPPMGHDNPVLTLAGRIAASQPALDALAEQADALRGPLAPR